MSMRAVEERAERIEACARGVLGDGAFLGALAEAAAAAEVSEAMLRWGLHETLTQWTAQRLLGVWRDELGDFCKGRVWVGPERAGLVLARTVPPAGLQSVMWAWLAGAKAFVRPAKHQRALWRAWHVAVARQDARLGEATEVCAFGREPAQEAAFAQSAQVLAVYGGETAVAKWRGLFGGEVVAHGHRVSAAFVGAEALRDEARWDAVLEGLAWDVCAWDQRGCLSPVCVVVEAQDAADEARWLRMAERWATWALPRVEAQIPAGPWSAEILGARRHFIRAQMLEAEVFEGEGNGGCKGVMLSYPHEAAWGGEGCLHRVVTARIVRSEAEAVERLRDFRPHLSCLGIAAGGQDTEEQKRKLAHALAWAGLNRVCDIGHMQRPPLGWRHDGRGVLLPLMRAVDLEPSCC